MLDPAVTQGTVECSCSDRDRQGFPSEKPTHSSTTAICRGFPVLSMSHRALLHAARVVEELTAGAGQVSRNAGRLLQDGRCGEVALIHVGGDAGCDSGVEQPIGVNILQAV